MDAPKKRLKLETALYPAPVVLVSSIGDDGRPNIITIAWAGVVSSEPPMVSISIRPHRFSHKLISATNDFVINIPIEEQIRKADFCGTVSGSKSDKFALAGFNAVKADEVKSPLIRECPVNIECKVKKRFNLGTHDIFIAEVVAVHADEKILDENGGIDYSLARPLVYNQGEYWGLRERVGRYGFTKGVL